MAQVLPNSGDMLPIVARSASGRFARPSPKNSTNLSTTPFLRSISVTVSTRSVAVAPAWQLARQPEADDLRDQHRDRLAEHRRLGLDAADAPAEHAEAVDHRRVRVGADQRVRIGLLRRAILRRTRRAPRYSRLTWCTMPVFGGTTLKLRNAVWPQRRNA